MMFHPKNLLLKMDKTLSMIYSIPRAVAKSQIEEVQFHIKDKIQPSSHQTEPPIQLLLKVTLNNSTQERGDKVEPSVCQQVCL